jgi:alkylation response protein AidB-like acyl-CoA dehydrogenase
MRMFDSVPAAGDAGEIVARVRALAPLVERHRDSFDEQRRVPEPLIDAIAEAGLFKLWLPRALGGLELSPLDFVDVVEAAAELDGTVGWLVGNGGGMSRAGGYLPEGVAGPWFADPRAFVVASNGANGTAVPAAGGYRVSGRWPFGSGIHHASHVMVTCAVANEATEPPRTIACYFARAEVRVIDNWHVSGLRGTGSCDFEATDVFVAEAQVHPYPEHVPTQPGIVYRLPAVSVFPLSVSVVPLGLARSAISTFTALAGNTTRLGTSMALAERETVQAVLGRAEADYRAARALLVDNLRVLMEAVDAGGERLFQARVAFRLACAYAAEKSEQVVAAMCTAAGTAAIFETRGLERCQRDVLAAVKHVAMTPNTFIAAGRIRLGLGAGSMRV